MVTRRIRGSDIAGGSVKPILGLLFDNSVGYEVASMMQLDVIAGNRGLEGLED
jgi:hypothetical protein